MNARHENEGPRYLGWYRVLLLLTAGAVVGLWWVVTPGMPDRFDPLGVRLGFAMVAFGLLVASYARAFQIWVRPGIMLLGAALFTWFLYMGHVNGLEVASALGLIPMIILTSALAHSRWALGLFLAWVVLLPVAAYQGVAEPAVPLSFMLVIHFLIVLGLGGMSLSRRALEIALLEANAELEQRVEARTFALAETNERLRHEVEVRTDAERLAVRGSRAKSTFLANMSHELRTPLTAIVGYSELLSEDIEDAANREDLDRIQGSARHLLGLIDDILDLSRIEADQLVLDRDSVELAGVLAEAAGLTRPLAVANGNVLRVDAPRDLYVAGDRMRLKQVFVNLLSNAAKFTTDGTVSVEVDDGAPDVLRVTVVDTGKGMTHDVLARVFDRFAQAEEGPTREVGGAGLGLAITQELVVAMGGGLSATSVPGEGSRFEVVLARGERP